MLPNETPTDFGQYSDHLIGVSALTKMAFRGDHFGPTLLALADRIDRDPEDAAAILDLSTIAQLQGNLRDALILQSRALELATRRSHMIARSNPPASAGPFTAAIVGNGNCKTPRW